MVTEVHVPDIGTFKNVPIIELLVKPGDVIVRDQPLMTLESDKATLEVPAPCAGRVDQVLVKLGDRVSQGTLLLRLFSDTSEVTESDISSPEMPALESDVPVVVEQETQVLARAEVVVPHAPVLERNAEVALCVAHASPTVRRYARELGVDLGQVRGSGPKGRILREDVQVFVKSSLRRGEVNGATAWSGLPPWPDIDFSQFGPVEVLPLTRIQKLSGGYLHRNWVSIPHVTNHEEADITELEVFRLQLNQERGPEQPKVTLLSLVFKVLSELLPHFPEFNASLQGETLVLKRYIHLGFAADTPQGLVVPVVRDVPKRGIRDLAAAIAALAAQARAGDLAPEAMQGGTFSVSSLGGIGGSHFTPIINAPEVAILGLGRARQTPVYRAGEVVPRWILPLSLSYDHRVIDGAKAARFNDALRQGLADLRRILL